MATLAMVIASTTTTGGLAALVVNRVRIRAGMKETIAVTKVKEPQTKEKES
jgi:hypothetical protein